MIPFGIWLNTRLAPFDDVRVRQAVNYAVDRNHLAELAGGPSVAQAGCQMLPPGVDGYRPFCPFTLHPNAAGTYGGPELAKARSLVAASGTKGERVKVWFYKIGIGRRNSAYLVAVLKSLGYRASRKLVPQVGPLWRPNRQAGAAHRVKLPVGERCPRHLLVQFLVHDPLRNNNYAEFLTATSSRDRPARGLQLTDRPSVTAWTRIDQS